MEKLSIQINNIRNVKEGSLELPFANGVYAFVGENGSGKSTLMECLSLLIPRGSYRYLWGADENSSVAFSLGKGNPTKWKFNNTGYGNLPSDSLLINGMYEGSLFYGTRFEDSTEIEKRIARGYLYDDDLTEADEYIQNKLSYILHGNYDYYKTLKRVRNRKKAEKLRLKNIPYFIVADNHIISQYRMSSEECLLISLLHFMYNSIERRSLPHDKPVIVLIDEIELALHPIAIKRLVEFLHELTANHDNLIVYISTHSTEVIRSMKPSHLFRVYTENGNLKIEDNCYPSYIIRDIYTVTSPDYLLLVEDNLAQKVVEKILHSHNLRAGRIIQCCPVGGWQNVLSLHEDFNAKRLLGPGAKIISVLDGDVVNLLTRQQKKIPHLFLPIASVEKFLYSVIKENADPKLKKHIGDSYFKVKSLNEIISEYNNASAQDTADGKKDTKKDNNKNFYSKLLKELESIRWTEEEFLGYLSEDIIKYCDVSHFVDSLKKLLS